MQKLRNDYRDAIDELAAEFRSRQFPDNISADDAREYVDTSVITAWWALEGLNRSEEVMLADVIAQRLTADQARTVICALAIGHAAKVQEILQAALVEQVARDLAYESQKVNDNYCPTDEEMSRGITPNDIDDPFLSEQRSFTRRHNASIAGWRRV
jgi:hypothetical protein